MSDITKLEKQKLETLLKMKQGFLLNFTDRVLQEFILKSVGIDIREDKYRSGSGSKANRLRAIWMQESNFVVAKLLFDLCHYWKEWKIETNAMINQEEQALYIDCINVCKRLVNSIDAMDLLPTAEYRKVG